MRKLLLLSLALSFLSCTRKENNFANPEGPFLGQIPPGNTPELFAKDFLSAGGDETSITFSHDGREVFYTMWTSGGDNLHSKDPFHQVFILTSHCYNGHWIDPIELTNNFTRKECYPFFHPAKEEVFFTSFDTGVSKLFVIRKSNGSWSLTKEVGNMETTFVSISKNNNLYFSHMSKIYTCRYIDSSYSQPKIIENILGNIDGANHVSVSPDEEYIIFDYKGTDSYGEDDLYISFNINDGKWTPARNMGAQINSPYRDKRAFVSRDSQFMFFSSNRINNRALPKEKLSLADIRQLVNVEKDSHEHIYWVSTKIIKKLYPDYEQTNAGE